MQMKCDKCEKNMNIVVNRCLSLHLIIFAKWSSNKSFQDDERQPTCPVNWNAKWWPFKRAALATCIAANGVMSCGTTNLRHLLMSSELCVYIVFVFIWIPLMLTWISSQFHQLNSAGTNICIEHIVFKPKILIIPDCRTLYDPNS